jgi:N-acetylmuramoyl-L-alanine amidase
MGWAMPYASGSPPSCSLRRHALALCAAGGVLALGGCGGGGRSTAASLATAPAITVTKRAPAPVTTRASAPVTTRASAPVTTRAAARVPAPPVPSTPTPTPAAPRTPTASAPPAGRAEPLRGKTITVDPGHNGGNFTAAAAIARLVEDGNGRKACDTTGTAAADGFRETDFNWAVAVDLRRLLDAAGARVVMTRSNNSGVGPCVNQRAAIGNRSHSDAAISIHADGGPADGSGFAVLVPAPIPGGGDGAIIGPSHALALELRATLEGARLHPSTYDGVQGLAPRTDLGGLNLSRVPKVFVEVANMRNPTDEAPMERAGFRARVAAALLRGLERFLG